MKSKKIILIAALSVGALLFLLAAFLLVRGVLKLREANDLLGREKQKLSAYYLRDPFPSKANIDLEKQNRDMLDNWFDSLFEQLSGMNVSSEENSPSKFVRNFEDVRKRLHKRAVERNATIDGGLEFGFGFERYFDSGELPKPDVVPQLSEQLMIVERVCEMLFDSGIKVLEQIDREVLEDGSSGKKSTATVSTAAPAAEANTRSARRPTPKSRKSTSKKTKAAEEEPLPEVGRLYTKMHFGLHFKAKEDAFLTLMNALAADPNMFVVVTAVQIQKLLPELVPVYVAEDEGAKLPQPSSALPLLPMMPGFPGAPAVPKPDVKEAPKQVPPWERTKDERIVTGPSVELPTDVTLEFDVYKFVEE